MIPYHDFSRLLPYDQCAYEMTLQERLKELKQIYTAIAEEHTAVEMELAVLAWRKNAGNPTVRKVGGFFHKVKGAPRQERVVDVEEARLLAQIKF